MSTVVAALLFRFSLLSLVLLCFFLSFLLLRNPFCIYLRIQLSFDSPLSAFEEQLRSKLEVDGAYLGEQSVQVNYAFGLLEGPALEFMRPWMQSARGTLSFSVHNFLGYLRGGYEDPEFAENARLKLGELRQGDRSSIDYIAECDKTFVDARSADVPDWIKIGTVRKGLNRKMGRLLVTIKEPQDCIQFVVRREYEAEDHRVTRFPRNEPIRTPLPPAPMPPFTPSVPPAFPRVEIPPAPEVEMTLGAAGQRQRAAWVSDADRNRRFAAGPCRRCGASGHVLRNCPHLPAQWPIPAVSTMHEQNPVPPVLESAQPGVPVSSNQEESEK